MAILNGHSSIHYSNIQSTFFTSLVSVNYVPLGLIREKDGTDKNIILNMMKWAMETPTLRIMYCL